MKVLAIVEKGNDGLYSMYTESEIADHGFGGFGDSVEIAKADFLSSIDEAKEMILAERGVIPIEFDDLKVEFKYDLASFFNYFDCINAGINESKLRQYKSGVAFAGEKTTRKILQAIKKLGAELSAASL